MEEETMFLMDKGRCFGQDDTVREAQGIGYEYTQHDCEKRIGERTWYW